MKSKALIWEMTAAKKSKILLIHLFLIQYSNLIVALCLGEYSCFFFEETFYWYIRKQNGLSTNINSG